MSIYLASDERPVLTYRLTEWLDTVWDIVIGDQRITVSSRRADSRPPVSRRHQHVLGINSYDMLSDPNGVREYLDREARRAAVEKGVPMPPGIEPTIKRSLTGVGDYHWVWWSVTL